jgi:hypothetical protein
VDALAQLRDRDDFLKQASAQNWWVDSVAWHVQHCTAACYLQCIQPFWAGSSCC